jgi:Fur family iron response transcriptional regulator
MGKTVQQQAVASTAERLRAAGLRPTRQRMELAAHLFRGHDRHVTAESLHDDVVNAGLLRQVVVDAARGYFDTNTGDHQHFFLEDEGALIDIPGEAITVAGVPSAPPGMTVERVDVVVRVKRA